MIIRFIVAAIVLCFTEAAFSDVRFEIFGSGTEVRDVRTGLVWRRCDEGQSWIGTACVGVQVALSHQQALIHAQAQRGWRLPNVKELASLVDYSTEFPAIDRNAFPAANGSYWTSTPSNQGFLASRAFVVGFNYGEVLTLSRSTRVGVRLVRN